MARRREKRTGVKRLMNSAGEPVALTNIEIVKELIRIENRIAQGERTVTNLTNKIKTRKEEDWEIDAIIKTAVNEAVQESSNKENKETIGGWSKFKRKLFSIFK